MDNKANKNGYPIVARLMIERKNKVILPQKRKSTKASEDLTDQIIATASHILLSCGYIMDPEIVTELKSVGYSKIQLQEICKLIVESVCDRIGMRVYTPFYPGFPTEVMEASEAKLIISAILHYASDGKITPSHFVNKELFETISKGASKENSANHTTLNASILKLGEIQEFMQIASNLIGSGTSISESDKDFLKVAIHYDPSVVPEESHLIPYKENKAIVIACLLYNEIYEHPLYQTIESPIDLLRVAVALSDGDVSLKNPCRFISFSRKIRRWFMDVFECIPGPITEDMIKHRERWLRLGEKIHPAAFNTDEYPRTIEAFSTIRNNPKSVVTFTAKIEKYYENKESQLLISELSERPGYFARELHHMMKEFPSRQFDIAIAFARVSHKVSVPVLYQVKAYYEHKMYLKTEGIYFPKGSTQNVFIRQNKEIVQIPDTVAQMIAISCQYGIDVQMKEKQASLYNNKIKAYIDPNLSDYLIPNSQRSAGKSLKAISRGSRISLGDTTCVRAFIHWLNSGNNVCERTDIDLSVAFMDSSFKIRDRISYYELRNNYACHSGDYVDAPAPDGASEFIDINLEEALQSGVRYAAITVHSYTLNKFYEIPDCFAGYMLLDKATMENQYKKRVHERIQNYNECPPVFIPEKVEMKLQLTSDSQYTTICIVDVEAREIIWCDLSGDVNKSIYMPNNVDMSACALSYMAKSVVNSKRESLFGLANTVAKARGYQLVDSPDAADVVYTTDGQYKSNEKQSIVQATDMDVWQSML